MRELWCELRWCVFDQVLFMAIKLMPKPDHGDETGRRLMVAVMEYAINRAHQLKPRKQDA